MSEPTVKTGPADPGRPRFCARCANPLADVDRHGLVRPVCPVCGWVYYARQAFGAGVLIEDGDRVLLVQRRNDPFREWWMLPSGFVEYGEFAPDSARREAEEETGLQVEIGSLFGLYYGQDDPRGPSHLAVYRARVVGGALAPGDDAQGLSWFARDALPERIAFRGQRLALADWQAAGG